MNAMITGHTLKETVHGNPSERRRLPAGLTVRLEPADNLPADAKIRWWAHPLNAGPNTWPAETAEWAEGPGVGLEAGDVLVDCGNMSLRLANAATAYDNKEHDAADRNPRRRHWNPYALPQYLARVDEVVADVCRGASPREALLRGFEGRLRDCLLRSLGLPATTEAERQRFVGGLYRPVTEPPATKAESRD